MTSSRLLLVCGVGRSGTSLVQAMLDSHPAIAFPRETHFFRHYMVPGRRKRGIESQPVEAFERLVTTDRFLRRLSLSPRALAAMAQDGRGRVDLGKLYLGMLEHECGGDTVAVIGDKDPRSIEYLPAYWSEFPSASILQVIRDPRDVLVSKKRASWSRRRPPSIHVFANAVQLELGRRYGRAAAGDRYKELIYERLLASPEQELRSVCEWLGVDFDSDMLNFAQAARELVTDEEMGWKKETLGPLITRNVGKWRKALTAREIALTEMVCSESFSSGDYERSGALETLNWPQRVSVWLQAGVLRVAKPIYKLMRQRVGAVV